jgi:hypothetical protein
MKKLYHRGDCLLGVPMPRGAEMADGELVGIHPCHIVDRPLVCTAAVSVLPRVAD